MRELLFPVQHDSDVGLQAQLRRHLVDAILDGRLDSDSPLPSCRRLAHALGVSRNTVVLTYQALTDEGFLVARERVGYFVNAEMQAGATPTRTGAGREAAEPPRAPLVGNGSNNLNAPDWAKRLRLRPSGQEGRGTNITHFAGRPSLVPLAPLFGPGRGVGPCLSPRRCRRDLFRHRWL